MKEDRRVERLLLMPLLWVLAMSGGCARQPPGTNTSSGVRLKVTLDFAAEINPNYYYFFLINNASDAGGTSGPVPVFNPVSGQTYGNGFATSSSTGKGGFTDFVMFSNNQFAGSARGGYGVYHVREATPGTDNGEANDRTKFNPTGAPINFVTPVSGQVNERELYFEIDLSQLVTDAGGQPLTDQNQAATLARAIRYLQINVVATNILPTDPTTAASKQVDSLGDNTLSIEGAYFTLDAFQTGLIPSGNGDSRVINSLEPSYSDVVGGGNPQIDLRSWSIQVSR